MTAVMGSAKYLNASDGRVVKLMIAGQNLWNYIETQVY